MQINGIYCTEAEQQVFNSNQNKVAIASNIQKWTTTDAYSISSIEEIGGLNQSKDSLLLHIFNEGTKNIALKHNQIVAGGYSFVTASGADYTLAPSKFVTAIFVNGKFYIS